MPVSGRVRLVGPLDERTSHLTEAVVDATDAVSADTAVATDPTDVAGTTETDCLVWVGPATRDGLVTLVERAGGRTGAPVVLVDDGTVTPEAAFDAGVTEYV